MRWITSAGSVAALAVLASLTACGLGETPASSVAGAASEAQQARQAQATEQQVRQKVEDAMRADAMRRAAAEKEGE
ncbi:MAG: hypothetical protein ACRETB_10740 [Steroidobacteraceae bacterium]